MVEWNTGMGIIIDTRGCEAPGIGNTILSHLQFAPYDVERILSTLYIQVIEKF